MAQSWEYDGVDLTTLGYNIRLIGSPGGIPGRRGENVVIPGKVGRLPVTKVLDERRLTLAMLCKNTHPTSGVDGGEVQLKANLDTLKEAFGRAGLRPLRWLFGGVTVIGQAEVIGQIDMTLAGVHYNFAVEFTMPDPFWYAAASTVVGPTNIPASPTNLALNNTGTYQALKPVLTITGVITNPRITVGSIWVQYTGAVGSGETLIIDCGAFTATLNGVNVANAISHSGALTWLVLPVGVATAVVTGTIGGPPTPTAKIEYTAAYL